MWCLTTLLLLGFTIVHNSSIIKWNRLRKSKGLNALYIKHECEATHKDRNSLRTTINSICFFCQRSIYGKHMYYIKKKVSKFQGIKIILNVRHINKNVYKNHTSE